jgi:hypothetical protein
MNCAITLDNSISIIEADTFSNAKEKVIKYLDINCPCYTIIKDDDFIFNYSIGGQGMPVVGIMKNENPQVIK